MKVNHWNFGVATALLLAAFGAQAQVTVGAVLPLSGSSASLGEDQRRGMELAVAKINEQGGVLAKNLKLQVEDSGGTANSALDAARTLVTVDKVPSVLGEV